MHWAQIATLQSDSQVTPELWVLSVELALGILSARGGYKIFSTFVYPCHLGSKKLQNTNSK